MMNRAGSSSILIIRLGVYASDPVYWYMKMHDGQKNKHGKLNNHAEIKNIKLQSGCCVKILVSASCIIFRRIDFKNSMINKNMKAIGFLLERTIIGDIDKFHTINLKWDNDFCYVAAVEHKLMNRWLGWLKEANISAKIIMPDVLALPFSLGKFSAFKLSNEWLIRNSQLSGFSISSEILAKILDSKFSLAHVNTFSSSGNDAINWQSTQYCDVLRIMAENIDYCNANFLCGKYNHFSSLEMNGLTIFRTAFLCLILSAAVCLNYWFDRYKIARDIDVLNRVSQEFYANTFPVDNENRNNTGHFNDYIEHYRDIESSANFIDLFYMTSPVIDSIDSNVNSVSFNKDARIMSYNISVDESNTVELKLKEASNKLNGVVLNQVSNDSNSHDVIFKYAP
ncbi:type II secretion system protein GspL [Yersinia intermedia]|uniref:type II secretion system protein GspL n=1 Tax=Yersinia intermedia TaxID=631 RepID=UPI0006790268|nr:type II secretion system protein GspL [Yersinia intermedia]